jgi:hypothetical protein
MTKSMPSNAQNNPGTTDRADLPPPIPGPLRAVVMAISVIVAISAAAGAFLAVVQPSLAAGQRVSWTLMGFELVILIAAGIGVFAARGFYREGPALALACVAGTILLGSAMGWQGAGRQLVGVSLTPFLAARALASAILGAVAAWAVLSRNGRSWRPLVLGLMCGIPVLTGCAALVVPAIRRPLETALANSPVLQLGAALLGYFAATVLLSACVHLIVRAFELGREPGSATSRRV